MVTIMKIDCGIIGLPNVGKSTVFNILTNSMSAKIANFPFCTIQPNIATVQILDTRICQLFNIVKSQCITYGIIEFVDIAGLIKGASQGEGLGDQTLSYIRDVKILCHVVRCFDDDKIVHISGSIDPDRDINIVNTELILFDILQCEKNISLLQKKNKTFDDKDKQKLLVLNKCLICLNNGVLLNTIHFSRIEQINIQKFNFLTFKPIIYIANTNKTYKNNLFLNKLNFLSSNKNKSIISCCASSLLLNDFNFKNNHDNHINNIVIQRKYILEKIIDNIFYLLNLHTFFTINTRVTRAWIFKIGTTALEAANKVHSDFKRGFIRTQVIKFNDFIDYKEEGKLKKKGKIYFEGKNYCVKDGDILKFLFNI